MRLRSAALALLVLALPALARQQGGAVTLRGQVVCSECWFEADRKTTPYGTPADLKCAVRCNKDDVPQALAVPSGGEWTLYFLENGKLEKPRKDFLDFIGKRVEATGVVRRADDKQYLKVDAMRVLDAPPEGARPAQEKESHEPAAPAVTPELALKDLSGAEQRLSALRGRIVVLNFWATWCVPCREEMPLLVGLQKRFALRGVQVIGASADDATTQKEVPVFVRRLKINFPVWLGATTSDMRAFGLTDALPATVVLDREGRIVGRILGVVEKTDLEHRVAWLLGERRGEEPAPLVNNLEHAAGHAEHDHGEAHGDAHAHGGVSPDATSSVPS